ncbi:MAG: methyltransferase domain-containing protein [Clostridia bacterium]|nr:methyltransferase domain-containing protein [Clostridia bacterium]
MEALLCPVCKSELTKNGNALRCANTHSFDTAKEGYVNLLTGSKSGSLIGDNREMARSRKSFLDKGYFEPAAKAVCRELMTLRPETVLDICCGEGYYTQMIKESCECKVYGFDISKEMVRLAAKRKCGATFFVANMSDIPLEDNSIDCAVHLFAPLCEKEFLRVIKPGGYLISVCPGTDHLWEMKAVLYDTPYKNEELCPEIDGFTAVKTFNSVHTAKLTCREDIDALFKMTPYYYHTSAQDKEKLLTLDSLKTKIDFYIRIYRKD